MLRVRAVLATLGATLLALPAAASAALPEVRVDDGRLLDEQGRSVVLHGINVHHKVAPFLPPEDAGVRTSFSEAEAAQLREWGWNTVRLAFSMDGLLPERGKVDRAYIRRYVELVRRAARHGQYVLVDFHQDEFSPKYKANGMPAWMADDDGIPFGASLGHPNDYLQPAVQRAFRNFFRDSEGQRTEFVRAFAALARALRDEPGILGYDMFNEPSCEFDQETGYGRPERSFVNDVKAAGVCLQPLYDQLVPALREADPNHPVFYEDFFNTAWGPVPYGVGTPPNKPWTFRDTGLSFHVYCPHPLFMDRDCDDLEREAFDRALGNARQNRAWPLLSEFGAVDDLAPIDRALENADRLGVSWQFWSLKTADDPHPGFGADSLNPDADGFSLIDKQGRVKEGKLRILARGYPERIAGSGAASDFDPPDGRFDLAWRPEAGKDTVVSLPVSVHYRRGYRVRATGARVVSAPGEPLLRLRGTGERATVTVTPGTGVADDGGRVCSSRRQLVVTVPRPRGARVRSARATISRGKARVVRRRGRHVVLVALRGARAGVAVLRIRAVTSRGAVAQTRRLRTCAQRRG